MRFDAHIEALRKGADGNLTLAKENRVNAANHQKMADDFTAEAVRHEELAQGFDLLADALATGQLTADQLRGIVNGMLADEEPDTADSATEAFVDVADAERYVQRDEYVNSTDDAVSSAERPTLAEQLRAVGAEQAALDAEADAFAAEQRVREAEHFDASEADDVLQIEHDMAVEAGMECDPETCAYCGGA